MPPQPAPPAAVDPALVSLLAFWADAGLTVVAGDAPVDRLTQPPRPERPAAVPARAAPSPPPASAEAPAPDPVPDILTAHAVEAARTLAAGAGDLAALQAAIAGFDGCALKRLGGPTLTWRGPPDPELMVIGEAPCAEDEQGGAPFTGRAGRMLDRMLDAIGLREQALVTATVFWRTPGDRPPSAADQSVCAPLLERAMALARPKALLLLGECAARSVLGRTEAIMRLRGRWFDRELGDGGALPALPIFSPAFLMAQPAAKRLAWEDLLTLAERVAALQRGP